MLIECPSCEGLGTFDIGDCEDGITETCSVCDGEGMIEEDIDEDVFIPERDAFQIGD